MASRCGPRTLDLAVGESPSALLCSALIYSALFYSYLHVLYIDALLPSFLPWSDGHSFVFENTNCRCGLALSPAYGRPGHFTIDIS